MGGVAIQGRSHRPLDGHGAARLAMTAWEWPQVEASGHTHHFLLARNFCCAAVR